MTNKQKAVIGGLLATGVALGVVVIGVLLATVETRYASPGGLPTGACDTPATACTITRAASLTGAGDALYLRGGVYTATKAVLTLVGTAAQPILVSGYQTETAILDGQGAAMSDTDSILRVSGAYATIRNLTIRNSPARGLSISSATNGTTHHLTIENVIVSHVRQRGIGGAGDDITLRAVTVEYASEAYIGATGGGWAAGISSYSNGDGTPSHRWTLIDSVVQYIYGECAIALRVDGWSASNNLFKNCYNVYTDKARNVLWQGNVIIQEPGWGKGGGRGDGFNSANENPQLAPPLFIDNLTYQSNQLIGAKDCFTYWQSGGTYSNVHIDGNTCQSNTGYLGYFYNVPPPNAPPVGNVFSANTCSSCGLFFGNPAGWTVITATATLAPSATGTPPPTPSPSQTVSPTATRTRTPTATPTASLTATETFTPSPTPSPTPILALNRFGIMATWNSAGLAAAQSLGVGIGRVAVFADTYPAQGCPACDALIANGFKLAVTWRANGGPGTPSTYPASIGQYNAALDSFLIAYGPRIEFINAENEADSVTFWTGTAEQYGELLNDVCTAAHARGVKCATHGIVWKKAALLAYAAYRATGANDAACSLAWRVFGEVDAPALCAGQVNATYTAQLDKANQYLDQDASADIDYLNMHAYSTDYYSLAEVANQFKFAYCQRVTAAKCQAVKFVSNEYGDRTGTSANVINVTQALADIGAAYLIYWNFDGSGGNVALSNSDGSLRASGVTLKTWIGSQ